MVLTLSVGFLRVAAMGFAHAEDATDGFGWLQRFYLVYDTSNGRVGIATMAHTDAETN